MAVKLQGLEDNARKVAIDELSQRLADALAVQLALKQAHWNVKGPNFIAIHELFDQVYGRLEGHVDTIAERIKMLDGTANGTAEHVAKTSSMKPYPLDIVSQKDHIKAVSEQLRDLGGKIREGIDVTEKAGEANAADILTAVSRDLDQDLWFVESHLEG